MKSADEIARTIMRAIIDDLELKGGENVAVLVNGLGATPKEELYIIYGEVHHILTEIGVSPSKVMVGEFSTSMEMAGLSISIMRLDEELETLLFDPAYSPFLNFM
jgi:dihydroxyacetone kinase